MCCGSCKKSQLTPQIQFYHGVHHWVKMACALSFTRNAQRCHIIIITIVYIHLTTLCAHGYRTAWRWGPSSRLQTPWPPCRCAWLQVQCSEHGCMCSAKHMPMDQHRCHLPWLRPPCLLSGCWSLPFHAALLLNLDCLHALGSLAAVMLLGLINQHQHRVHHCSCRQQPHHRCRHWQPLWSPEAHQNHMLSRP